MVFTFKLPDIGEGIQEGEIVRWLKKEGEAVNEDEPFVEVMTDKATVELTSPRKGTIGKHHVPEGQMAKVGQVIVDIIEAAATSSAPAGQAKTEPAGAPAHGSPAKAKAAEAPKAAAEEKTLFDLPKEMAAATKRIQRRDGATPLSAPSPVAAPSVSTGATAAPGSAASAASAVPASSAPAAAAATRAKGQKATAAPAVRRFAREQGVDLNEVAGTGPQGRVLRDDVARHASGATAPLAQAGSASVASASHPAPAGGLAAAGGARFSYNDVRYSTNPALEERLPLRGLRRTIAKAMERSKFTATHFTYVAEVDCDRLVELRESAKELAAERGVKLSYLPFIAKAAVAALRRHPDVNVAFDETTSEIIRKKYYHIGIATATDAGLIVPVVKDADKKGMLAIAAEIADLSERTKAGKAKQDELTGSTFTITSLGKLGGVLATPILNYPEVAIMGVHEMKQVPVVKDGKLAIGWRMNLSFSFDHRIVDGYNGAMFANTLVSYLENPQLLLLEAL